MAPTQATLAEASVPGPAPATDCPTCGESFASEMGVKVHHVQAHGESIAGVEVECAWCGESDRVPPCRDQRSDHHFCDRECQGAWQSENQAGENNPNWKGKVEVECAWCGESKWVYPYHTEQAERIFCDGKCRGAWQSENQAGENNPSWNGGKVEVECAHCGEPKRVEPARAERSDHPFCDEECRGAWMSENWSGENHPGWKGKVEVECAWCGESKRVYPSYAEQADRYFCDRVCQGAWMSENQVGVDNPMWTGGWARYYGPSFPRQRRRALDRADGACEACGLSREAHLRLRGRDLHAHHTTPFKPVEGLFGHRIANALSNLMIVCRSCHDQLEPVSQKRREPFVRFATGLWRLG